MLTPLTPEEEIGHSRYFWWKGKRNNRRATVAQSCGSNKQCDRLEKDTGTEALDCYQRYQLNSFFLLEGSWKGSYPASYIPVDTDSTGIRPRLSSTLSGVAPDQKKSTTEKPGRLGTGTSPPPHVTVCSPSWLFRTFR